MAAALPNPCRRGATLLPAACACGLAVAGLPALAQDSARAFSLVPTFDTSVSATHTRNEAGVPANDTVVQLRPGLQASLRSGRARGSLSYALNAIRHSQSELSAENQNTLDAELSAEAVEKRVFVDASAVVAQSSLSPYGQQSAPGSAQENLNRVEVGTVTVSPYVRGPVGRWADYELRLSSAATHTRKSAASDSTSLDSSFKLDSVADGSVFGWGLQAAHRHSKFRLGRGTDDDIASISVSARPDIDWRLELNGGWESTNVLVDQRQRYGNAGATVTWTPNEHTRASYATERRYFGTSHRLALEYRLPRSALRLASTRDASTSADPNGIGQSVTLYQLTDALLQSQFPDPAQRDGAVRDLLNQLGRDPNSVVVGGFVNSAVTVQQRTDFGWTYSGLRLTVALQAFASQSSVLGATAAQPDNGAVRQRGYTGEFAWRLTPTASASLSGSRLMTPAGASQPGTDLKSMTLSWNDRLGRYVTASLSARYSVFDSAIDPYHETAVTAALSLRY